MRFTLPKLFLTVTIAALACAGLTLRTRAWAEAIVTLTAAMYGVTGLLAVGRSGRARASAIAFATVGCSYLLLVTCNTFSPIRDLMLTNRALILAGRALQVPTQSESTADSPTGFTNLTGFTINSTLPNSTQTTANSNITGLNVGSGTLTLSSANTFTGTTSLDFDWWESNYGFGSGTFNPIIPAGAFLLIGHGVWSWLLALLAGWFCGVMYAKRARGAV